MEVTGEEAMTIFRLPTPKLQHELGDYEKGFREIERKGVLCFSA